MSFRRLFQWLGLSAAARTIGVLVMIGALWTEHRSAITLPAPTGPFAVGRSVEAWTDPTRTDALAPRPGTKSELLLWLWYPSASPAVASPDDYLPAYIKTVLDRESAPATWLGLLTRDLSKVHAHSVRQPDVAGDHAPYPVAILRGGASVSVMTYTTLAEDLASHGYVVVGIDAPYRTGAVVFPDGRIARRTNENNPELCWGRPDQTQCLARLMAAWIADITFVVDRLAQLNTDSSSRFHGRLDSSHIGVFGHSFGGAQAAQFCHQDTRCKAGADIDGAPFGSVIQSGINVPFLFLVSGEGDFSTNAENRQILADIQSIYDRLPPDGRERLKIQGASHFTFTDDGALLKSGLIRGLLRLFGKLRIDAGRQLGITAYCVRSFFDAHLSGRSGGQVPIATPEFSEIQPF